MSWSRQYLHRFPTGRGRAVGGGLRLLREFVGATAERAGLAHSSQSVSR